MPTDRSAPAPTDPELARFLREELGDGSGVASPSWTVTAPLWVWRGTHADGTPTKAVWHFVTISGDAGAALRAVAAGRAMGSKRGFGSLRITATIGTATWQTSLFPHRESGGYLLPVKAAVRKTAGLIEGGDVTVQIAVGAP